MTALQIGTVQRILTKKSVHRRNRLERCAMMAVETCTDNEAIWVSSVGA
jgi:hypothetical protein